MICWTFDTFAKVLTRFPGRQRRTRIGECLGIGFLAVGDVPGEGSLEKGGLRTVWTCP